MIDTDLLSILVCPLSRKPLVLDGEFLVSTDAESRRRYRIDDGIPIMLIEESEELSQEEWQQIVVRHGGD
jgi:uncharacterized protein